ncbi:hypothetical protein [Adhaeretor mobilis]|uniref:Uncharacterized protein n=1 Tax=Adhaeretor mobilis TaxID=1930276 RepID=A0A517MQZ5_9BACT|nr:hypothetical protein [Adhaeretor mobilis]QDS97303.1 hypothetical protein HG15A2_05640 [Adhaeretor mobilis]
MRYLKWIAPLVFWDGVLPAFVILVTALSDAIFGKGGLINRNAFLDVMLIAGLPLAFFVLRILVGRRRLHELAAGQTISWRLFFFVPALLILALFEAGGIGIGLSGVEVQPGDLRVFLAIYGAYFLLMAVAFLPVGSSSQTIEIEDEDRVENPWASLG